MSQGSSLITRQSLAYRSRSKRISSFLLPDMDEATANSILKQSVISNFEHNQYSIMCKAPIGQLIFFEALGTFLFLFGCSCINNPQQYQVHALYAVFLLFAICMSGSLTGANINPSVTLSNYLRKENKYTLKMIPIYFTGQFVGAITALVAAKYINDVTLPCIKPNDTAIVTILRQIANQMMGTILMVFFLLEITNPNTTFIQNEISGFLSIVLFFYLSIALCPSTNSFAINFAITLSIELCAIIFPEQREGSAQGWQWIWIYLIGDIAGVFVATLFYDKIFEPIISKLREVRRQSLSFIDFTEVQD